MTNKIEAEDYPVSQETLAAFGQKIVDAVKVQQPITFNFDPRMGGARAWIKFIINKPKHTKFIDSLEKYKLVTFEPEECLESSNLAFFYLLLEKLKGNANKKYEEYSLNDLIREINSYIQGSEINLVVFLIQLDSFQGLNPVLGNLLHSFRKDNKDKITFVTTLSKGLSNTEIHEKLGSFGESLLTCIENIEILSNKDILQSIKHWSKKLDFEFNETETNAILKFSEGKTYISKILCQEIKKAGHVSNPFILCKDVSTTLRIGKVNSKLKLQENNVIYYNDRSINSLFSYQELSTLLILVKNQNQVVNRDDIAEALWHKKAFEKYSDWAIDKFVSLLRQKLKKLNFSGEIKAKKGEGFILIQ